MADTTSEDFKVLVTAAEAWPAFENAVLDAEKEVLGGFRIFDLSTPLVGARAQSIGADWFDLLAYVLGRGVRVDIAVSDFDPVMATPLHEAAWTTVRQGFALAEVTGAGPEQLQIRATLHPARAGGLPRLAFSVPVRKAFRKTWEKTRSVERERAAVRLDGTGTIPALHPVSHHHKLAVIDGKTLYIGGLDLNRRRWDTPEHDRASKDTWSDMQLLVRGPEAHAARRHLLSFEAACAGEEQAPSIGSGFLRTLSRPREIQFPFLSPQTVKREIEQAYLDAISKAEHLIHIETQYLRSSRIAKALAERAFQKSDLHLILILPHLPEEALFGADVTLDMRFGLALRQRAFGIVQAAFGNRAVFATPAQRRMAARDARAVRTGAPLIHVHNKLMVIDDSYGIVGSANLNGRSLRWDTEAALELRQPDRVAALREALFSHWWPDSLTEAARDPARMAPIWSRMIKKNALIHPERRPGLLIPLDAEDGSDLAQPLPGVTENMV